MKYEAKCGAISIFLRFSSILSWVNNPKPKMRDAIRLARAGRIDFGEDSRYVMLTIK